MPLPQLHVDIGVGLIDALAHGNQAVVDADHPNNENDYDRTIMVEVDIPEHLTLGLSAQPFSSPRSIV